MESHGHNPANMAGSYIRFSPVSDLKPPDLRTQISEISIERSRLTLADVIQEGTFGKIYHGVLLGEGADMEVENDVFVKTVTEQASESQVNLFITESCMMLGLSFPSIQTIRSMCMDNERQPLAVFPYASNGLLKKFLHKCKIPGEGQGTQSKLSTQELVHMGIQIIRGVQYLHKKKIIHKDLATRNCVVGQDLNVKITEKALSRDLFPNDYHCLGDNENRPVKWLAIESLIDKRFSPASDVWAFGVLLWELMTLGQQPYPDVDPFEMAQYLREGYRLSQPINCPDELFAVMACCWALCPDDRPKFTQLLQCLQDFYAHLGRYI
ncbi:PREDICTED: tyrosine-protein kinase RYK-like [Priapulus caudatus]|uniref:Tyrosine-protein kinase RYK-like n=1 Tax=Priapulus caudatus TaxID=37621 RepID=A0ABM1EC94_PRICU|nr:PREDICTED: tyrosine-protein kinase RYK-like [Priapulus caudatus]